tara:strand:- start:2306 stop:3181 length:876 start_codon:yes stop_codon:yes gene_type:complete
MEDMIKTLVFSKDRACQLDLLLRSLSKHAEGKMQINVLYDYSSEDFGRGYEKIKEMFPEVLFHKETSFKSNVLDIISDAEKYICFFTDDGVMFSDLTVTTNDLDSLFSDINPMSLSLRLGQNTVVQDPYENIVSKMPVRFNLVHDKFLAWDIRSVGNFEMEEIDGTFYKRYYACNFTMPISLDGHIYRKKYLLPVLTNIVYHCPNTMEVSMGKAPSNMYPNSMLSCLPESIVVSSPNNKVQDKFGTMAGQLFPLSTERLNTSFLAGKRLDMGRVYRSEIKGCHQELNMEVV